MVRHARVASRRRLSLRLVGLALLCGVALGFSACRSGAYTASRDCMGAPCRDWPLYGEVLRGGLPCRGACRATCPPAGSPCASPCASPCTR